MEVMANECLKDDNDFEQASNGGDEKCWDSNYLKKLSQKDFLLFDPINSKYGVAISSNSKAGFEYVCLCVYRTKVCRLSVFEMLVLR